MSEINNINDEIVAEDDRPSNTLELFTEVDEVVKMIRDLANVHKDGFEHSYEKYAEILSRYQEQPHLLDPHIPRLLEELLIYICDAKSPETLFHAAFKYLYQISNVRTYKVLVKFLPHELSDLEFALVALEKQQISDSTNWETRYMLLLWMSILILNPFHMSRLDAFSPTTTNPDHIGELTKMERIYKICQNNCLHNDTCSRVAAYLCAKYFIRIDIKEVYLPLFIDWVAENHTPNTNVAKFGQLAAIAAILKHGKRDDLLPYCQQILRWILTCDYKESTEFLKYKFFIKIIQRLGLIFLKPRLAEWRYQRGSRSLTANLNPTADATKSMEFENLNSEASHDEDDEIVVPDEIEEIVEELLQALRSPSSDIRWLAAKGLGRVTCRLPKSLGDEVVGSVTEIFNPLEPHEAWHGACLAIAEMAKRGLLLTYRLSTMVPHLLEALVYDEMKGYMSVGQHIRDAACYMSWAFARAYDPADLQPFVEKIAAGLLITTVFDREINCRRAASAAFQESVGRLGTFPHGIDILTEADFYSVGLRVNSYLQISDYIAQYEEYTRPLIDHLVKMKVNHWDTTIRELTAKALNRLTKRDPKYLSEEILPDLFEKTNSIDINMRHGAVLAIGEVVLALSEFEVANGVPEKYLKSDIIALTRELVRKFIDRNQFRGISGEMMKQACSSFIKNCSVSKIAVTDDCLDSWQTIIDKCLVNKSAQIRDGAITALTYMCNSYYNIPTRTDQNIAIVQFYLKGCLNNLEEWVRMGYLSALGGLPKFMLKLKFEDILAILKRQSSIPNFHSAPEGNIENVIVMNWSEARRDSIKALSRVVQTVGFDGSSGLSMTDSNYLDQVFHCFLKGLDEYTTDNRGDIGAWVREASVNALHSLLTSCPHKHLKPDIVHRVMIGLVRQAVEKIDRTRGLAGKLFGSLVHYSPTIPHIKRHDELKAIFPEDSSKVLWLFADHTLPLFCSLLEYPEYSSIIILGLSASIGQLTESLRKYSSTSMLKFMKAHPKDIPRIGSEIISVFQENLHNDRITHLYLNFLDVILSSGIFYPLFEDESSTFADDLLRLVNAEMKNNKKLYKLVSSINVYCQLIQVPKLGSKLLTKMSVFLGQTHVHVRKSAANKLYEAVILHGDTCGIPEENLDDILTILSETDWGMPLDHVRPIRNNLCELMGVKAPVSLAQTQGQ